MSEKRPEDETFDTEGHSRRYVAAQEPTEDETAEAEGHRMSRAAPEEDTEDAEGHRRF